MGERYEVPILVILNIKSSGVLDDWLLVQHPRRLERVRYPQIQIQGLPAAADTDRNLTFRVHDYSARTTGNLFQPTM
jgi:hypothetical protein